MKVVIKHPAHTVVNKDCFVVHFSHEHGDADVYTKSTCMMQSYSDEELIEFVEKFDEIATIIENNRTDDAPIPPNFQEMCYYRGVEIPIEHDCICIYGSAEDYYACPSIDSIEYYDDNGFPYYVTIESLRKE